MPLSNRSLVTAKQQLSRHLNDIAHLVSDCEKYKEGWQFPSVRKELYVFTRTQRSIVQDTIAKLESKIDVVMKIFGETTENLLASDSENPTELGQDFDNYWNEKKGASILEEAREMIQSLEMRLVELSTQEMQIASSDEFEEIERQRVAGLPSVNIPQPTTWQPLNFQTEFSLARSNHQIPAHWFKRELRIPEFFGEPTEFEPFWEIFSELVDKQPYSDIEKLTILLDKCKGEAPRALKYLPRKGSSYKDAVQQLKEQFKNSELNVKLLIQRLGKIPTSSEEASQLRATLNDIMAIIAPLSRAESHIDAREYKNKVRQKFPETIQNMLVLKEYEENSNWTMDQLIEEIRKIVKKFEITQAHTSHIESLSAPKTTMLHIKHQKSVQYRCAACGGTHKIRFCNRFRTVQARRQRILELNKCFKCFSTQHQSNQCRSSNCRNCGGSHNVALCVDLEKLHRNISYRNNTSKNIEHSSMLASQKRRKSHEYSVANQQKFYRRDTRSRSRTRAPNLGPTTSSTSKQAELGRRRSLTPYRQQSGPKGRISAYTLNPAEEKAPTELQEELIQINKARISGGIFGSEPRLMVITLPLIHNNTRKLFEVYAILDTGATRSFISEKMMGHLQLTPVRNSSYILTTFGGNRERRKTQEVLVCAIDITGKSFPMRLLTSNTITEEVMLPRLSTEDIEFAMNRNVNRYSILNKIDLEVIPEVLLGIDYYNEILDIRTSPIRLPSGLYAVPTIFGHAITGIDNPTPTDEMMSFHSCVTSMSALDNWPDISSSWTLESLGITDPISESDENLAILKEFCETIEIRNKQIFVRFPWKSNKMDLDSNYKVALSRLHQLYHSLRSKVDLWQKYCNIIEEQLQREIIEDVPQKERSKDCPIYYIPHQAVLKPTSTTTKVRIVLDASSKRVGQLSLNDVIYQGPTILPNLLGILLRIRFGRYILTGDVEKAFHMIHLQESQRDATRFLWLKDTSQPPSSKNIRELRFTRVPFGTKTSPSLLAMSIKYSLDRNENQKLCAAIARNLYVDNVILLADSIDDAVSKYRESKKIFEDMSMNLREFATNSNTIRSHFQEKDKASLSKIKLLGLMWDTTTDTFTIQSKLQYEANPTKRKVLKAIHTNFDPLGFLTHLLVKARIFLQSLWVKQYEWDQNLSKEDMQQWNNICSITTGFSKVWPRFISDRGYRKFTLYTFTDASTNAYAACTYIRYETDKKVHVQLLCAKYRLTPVAKLTGIKTGTIPKLELLALLIGTQLTEFIRNELDLLIEKIRIFSDSKIALSQIHSGKHAGTFVNNRVRKIRTIFQSWKSHGIDCQYLYIKTDENPADCATKGVIANEFQHHYWWYGPSFLLQEENQWSQTESFEMKWSESEVALQTLCKIESGDESVFRFALSNWTKLRRSAAYVLKFIKKISKDRYNRTQSLL